MKQNNIFHFIIFAFLFLFQTKVSGQDAEIIYGNQSLKLNKPTEIISKNLEKIKVFNLKNIGIKVSISFQTLKENEGVFCRKVSIESKAKLTQNLTVRLPLSVSDITAFSFPSKNGTLKTGDFTNDFKASYQCAGVNYDYENNLAFPMVSFSKANNNYMIAADPYFSTAYHSKTIEWTYPKEIGLTDTVETRLIYTIPYQGNLDDAVNLYYKYVLSDVPPGPAWIHDIAMVDYDYISDKGRGWYNDIDSLNANISREERNKICLSLHGWYDLVGRYCYNDSTGKLDNSWKSFAPSVGTLTLKDIHNRIAYAKSNGYRVVLYYADGIISGTKVPSYTKEKLMEGDAWSGEDVVGKSFKQNPCHPEVYKFYVNYAKALANEFGAEVDGFVWDETFYISSDNRGNAYYPGYADRTFMRLVKECTSILHKVNDRAAFLTSDVITKDTLYNMNIPPYALVSDGTYMDSNCNPDTWSYNIFSNYRNSVWSCNWYPVTKFNLAKYGVLNYQAAVPISNGYGDSIGFSELPPELKSEYLKLFRERSKNKTKLKYFQTLPTYSE